MIRFFIALTCLTLLGCTAPGTRSDTNDSTSTALATASDSADSTSGAGTAVLSWAPPSNAQGGAPHEDLQGYRIYYSRTPGEYTDPITIDDPNRTIHVIRDLAPGTYYFVMTAVDSAGNESDYTQEVRKDVSAK